MRRLLRALGTLALANGVACAGEGAGHSTRAMVVPAASATARNAAASVPAAPVPPSEVTVALLGEDGAFAGPFYEPRPDAAALVRPCFDRAREGDPALAGWITFDLAIPRTGATRVTKRDASPLPPALVDCIEAALAALRPRNAHVAPGSTVAYVSLR